MDDCRGFDTGGGGVRTSCIGVSSQFDHQLAAAYCVGFSAARNTSDSKVLDLFVWSAFV